MEYCETCLKELSICGIPAESLFLDICEVYWLTKQAALVDINDSHVHQIIKLLELKRYIIFTYYIDPYVFVTPMRGLKLDEGGCPICDRVFAE